jgi:GPH family glycoside/pentoside/hexuronide:cation symporter
MYAATLFVDLIKGLGADAVSAWRIVFSIFAVIRVICVLLGASAIREKDYATESVKPQSSLISSAKSIFKNKSLLTFFAGDLFSYVSMAFFQAAMLYYITMLLNVPESQSFLVMLSAIGVALCLFPMIVSFSKKYGKKTMLVIASVIFTVVFAFIFFGDLLATFFVGAELVLGMIMGVVVAFPFAAINILPQSCMSDIIRKDSLENGVNREGFFSATKTFVEKIANSLALVAVSSVLAIGAASGESVGMLGVKLTGVFAGIFSLLSLIFFILYDEKSVTCAVSENAKGEDNE